MPSQPVALVLSKLGKVKRSGAGWAASCPVEGHKHGDRDTSLSVAQGADGRALVTCHVGHSFEEIAAAMNLELPDLFPDATEDKPAVVAEYLYTDEDGKPLFIKERHFPKDFRLKKPSGTYGIKNVRRVLYRLPRVIEGVRNGRTIWVVAGEKDANSLEALGEIATTNSEGEGASKWKPEYTEVLKGARVRVIVDRDEKGREHGQGIAALLQPVVASLELWEAAEGKDVTAHLRAGRKLDELVPFSAAAPVLSLVKGTRTDISDLVLGVRNGDVVFGEARLPELDGLLSFEGLRPRKERTGVHCELRVTLQDQIVAYSNINVSRHEDRTKLSNLAADNLGDKGLGKAIRIRLDHFCVRLWDWWIEGDVSEWSETTDIPPIQFLLEPYVMAEAGTIVFGFKGQGKSWLGILWSMMLQHGISSRWKITKPRRTLFVNLERGRDSVDRRRAMVGRVLGVQGMRTLHARGRTLSDVAETLRAEVDRHGIEHLMIDSLSRAGTGKLIADDDSNRAMDLLNGIGCSWTLLAHTAKADGEHVFGSVMHENAADVVVQLASEPSSVKPTSLGCRLKVTAANDLPRLEPEVYALDFDNRGLSGFRNAEQGEFPDLAVSGQSSADLIGHLLSLEGPSSVNEICEGTGLSRSTVYEALKLSVRFTRTVSGGGRGKKTVWALRTLSDAEEGIMPGERAW